MKFNLAKKWLKITNMLHLQMYFFKNQKVHEKCIRKVKKSTKYTETDTKKFVSCEN